ncbi:cation:proton antiporter domain-containing protein [Methanofollis ethanolicus]|uniref:cation:proton antiporter domain-containing protein n=1 Tax=Methanofollis ethanolicus TaxID=488124 RepID=UPI00082F16C5|nr:cation:proton antiporter [Methanofollis ethanolicus]
MVDETLVFLAAFVTVLFLYSLVSRRIERTVITAPMVFVAAGLLLGTGGIGLVTLTVERSLVLLLAETALVLTLFSDASRINIHALKVSGDLPARLLLLGLPLTIIAGVIAAVVLLTDLSLLEAAILACLLAPTDAALGEAIVTSDKVPLRIRQALNVEAGLNDGAVIPVLTILWALAVGEETYALGSGDLFVLALVQIGIAVLVGGAVGYACGWVLSRAAEKEWMAHTYEWIALMGIAIIAWVLADLLGGSGFIAAFVAGFATGAVYRQVVTSLIVFTVAEGEVLGHLVFFILGVISYLLFEHVTFVVLLYAVLSLTVVRMVPVAVSLVATRLNARTVVFLGWFGPRGLASIVLMLTTLEEAGALPGMRTLAAAAVATVMLSVFAHGISANPAIARYSRHAGALHDAAPEKEAAADLPTRWGDEATTGPGR